MELTLGHGIVYSPLSKRDQLYLSFYGDRYLSTFIWVSSGGIYVRTRNSLPPAFQARPFVPIFFTISHVLLHFYGERYPLTFIITQHYLESLTIFTYLLALPIDSDVIVNYYIKFYLPIIIIYNYSDIYSIWFYYALL